MSETNIIVLVGTALYGSGDGWQSELARQLGVPSRTVRHWVAGDYQPRAGVYRDLLEIVTRKHEALAGIEPLLVQAIGTARP